MIDQETAFRLYRRAQKFLALPLDEGIEPNDYGEDEASEVERLVAELAVALSDAVPHDGIDYVIVPRAPSDAMTEKAVVTARRHSRDAAFPATGVRQIWHDMIAQHEAERDGNAGGGGR